MGGAYLGKYRCKDASKLVNPGQEVSAYWRFPLVMVPVTFDPSWVQYDDGAILLANKPAGIPTQGRRDADYMAFFEMLKKHLKGYLALHHRLDQDTSGLILFSRDRNLNKAISDAFQNRHIQKTYLAVCEPWQETKEEILVDAPLGPLRQTRGTRQIVTGQGKPAKTRFRLLAKTDRCCLVSAQPLTGRTHQIRAHLSHLSMPLTGDTFYGAKDQTPFMLHCAQLAWPDLGKLEGRRFRMPPPNTWRARIPEALHQAITQWEANDC